MEADTVSRCCRRLKPGGILLGALKLPPPPADAPRANPFLESAMTTPCPCRMLITVMVGAVVLTGPFVSPGAADSCDHDGQRAILLDPSHEENHRQAPDEFLAHFHTSAGDFRIAVNRTWAPHGADRFFNLVQNGFYDGCRFFRVVPGFVVQWGIHGDPDIAAAWDSRRPEAVIEDDPVVASNTVGRVTFATAGPQTRTTQLFINFGDNSALDDPETVGSKFAPFGEVIDGMEVVESIYARYGERPRQGRIAGQGNAYLEEQFPKLDHIIAATIVEPDDPEPTAAATQPAE